MPGEAVKVYTGSDRALERFLRGLGLLTTNCCFGCKARGRAFQLNSGRVVSLKLFWTKTDDMKKKTFFLGLISGLVLSRTWRVLTKEGIKFGIQAGRKVREISQQAMEDIEDIAAEATEEVAARPHVAKGGGMKE